MSLNFLSLAGAIPKYSSLNAFIEEGMEIATLERIIKTLTEAASVLNLTTAADLSNT